jgi:MFS family permease
MAISKNALAEWRGFWFLPIAAALGYSTSVMHVYAIGPFIEPLQREFDWSRAQITLGLTIAAFISAVFCIPLGMLVDRIGPRRVGLVGVLIMAAASALLSTATGKMTNWALLWVLVAFGAIWVQATIWTSAVASRFHASRGLAFALTLSGASISAAVFPVLSTWLIGAYGWRVGFAALPGIWVALVFPVLFFGFRGAQDAEQKGKAAAPNSGVVRTGLTLAEGLRSLTLYKLLIAAGLFTFTAIGALVHFIPILTDSGTAPLTAAGIAALVGVFSIIGRLGTGFLLDKFPAHLVGAVAFMLPIVTASLLLFDGANPSSQMVAAVALGLTVGSEVDVIAYLAAKHFGLKNFGALYGALVMALALGIACGPLAAGAVFDHYGSYEPFLMLAIVLMALSALALFSLGSAARADEAVVPCVR